MTNCTCGKTPPAQMLCTECDEQPLPAPVWNRAFTAAALANLAEEIARLQDRVKVLEKTIADWTAEK